jgi:hypothetical protein
MMSSNDRHEEYKREEDVPPEVLLEIERERKSKVVQV